MIFINALLVILSIAGAFTAGVHFGINLLWPSSKHHKYFIIGLVLVFIDVVLLFVSVFVVKG
jgi:hypothetical protein